MSRGWEALAARAAGLAGHLLDENTLRTVDDVATPEELTRVLRGTAYRALLPDGRATADGTEAVLLRTVALRLATLARWARHDPEMLGPIFLVYEAHAIRNLCRGIVAGAPPSRRTEGAVPTPALDAPALEFLAGSDTIGALAATLRGWGHPLGPALAEGFDVVTPDLFDVERALWEGLAHALQASARRRDADIRDFVAIEIDRWNMHTALVFSASRHETDPSRLFLPGGVVFLPADLSRASTASSATDAAALLARVAKGSLFEAPLRDVGPHHPELDRRLLDGLVSRLRRRSKSSAPGSATVLLFLVRLERERRALVRAAWRVSLPSRRGGAVTGRPS